MTAPPLPVGMHYCPASGCFVAVPKHMLACRPHWFMLPRNLRNQLGVTYRAKDWPAHRAAMLDIFDWFDTNVRPEAKPDAPQGQ